jgi:hypothetical protein
LPDLLRLHLSDEAPPGAVPVGPWFLTTAAGKAADLRAAAHALRLEALALRSGLAAQDITIPAEFRTPIVPGLYASISHTRGAVVVATARRPVGVDIEPLASRHNPLRVAQRWFAPEEAASIAALEGDARALAFTWRWCAKEALLKVRGLKLGAALRIPVGDDALLPFVRRIDDVEICVHAPGPGYVCVVAC